MINSISQVSFGNKVVLGECKVQDKQTGEKVPAAFFEYTCTDPEDVIDFMDKSHDLPKYRSSTLNGMQGKVKQPNGRQTQKFYGLEANNEIIGMAKVHETYRRPTIETIETANKKYKYAGQSLIALIGKNAAGTDSGSAIVDVDLNISDAIPDAIDFYTNKCGFKPNRYYPCCLWHDDLSGFIKNMEEKTEIRLLDKSV